MYNPEYCARPHVVALNKIDMPDAAELQEEIAAEIAIMAQKIQVHCWHRWVLVHHPCQAHCSPTPHPVKHLFTAAQVMVCRV